MSTVEGGGNIVTNGLVLCLDAANPKSIISGNTTWNDLTTNFNNTTLINGPSYSSANNGSIVFDGVDDFGRCLDNDTLDFGNGNFTVSVWFIRTTNPTNNLRLLSKGASADTPDAANAGFAFLGSNTELVFTVNPTGTRVPASPNTSLSLNTWTNIVGLVERGVSLRTYKNAVQSGTNTAPVGSVSGTSNLILGAHANGTGLFWSGNIAQVLIYNKALTDQEILQNYNATKGRFGL